MEFIKGVPNVLSSRVWLANLRKARLAAGKPPSPRAWCVFCGRPFMSRQGRQGHLKGCEKRRTYLSTMVQGWHFTIGSRVFIVRTNRWSWLREAAALETEFNERILAGEITEDQAQIWYHWFVHSHNVSFPWTDAAVEDVPATETAPATEVSAQA